MLKSPRLRFREVVVGPVEGLMLRLGLWGSVSPAWMLLFRTLLLYRGARCFSRRSFLRGGFF